MNKQAYMAGFAEACISRGVDPALVAHDRHAAARGDLVKLAGRADMLPTTEVQKLFSQPLSDILIELGLRGIKL